MLGTILLFWLMLNWIIRNRSVCSLTLCIYEMCLQINNWTSSHYFVLLLKDPFTWMSKDRTTSLKLHTTALCRYGMWFWGPAGSDGRERRVAGEGQGYPCWWCDMMMMMMIKRYPVLASSFHFLAIPGHFVCNILCLSLEIFIQLFFFPIFAVFWLENQKTAFL